MQIFVFPNGQLRAGDNVFQCALGRAGVVAADFKHEGDGATPAGVWPVRRVWYRADRIERLNSELPTRAITPADGWCDDINSPAYNRPVALPFVGTREKLWREDDLYDIVLELGYNDQPVVRAKGSAIFIHIARPGYPPTDGCVALSRDDLQQLVPHLKPGSTAEVYPN